MTPKCLRHKQLRSSKSATRSSQRRAAQPSKRPCVGAALTWSSLGPTLTRNDRHHLPYLVKKAHPGTRVLVLHTDGARHHEVDAIVETGSRMEQVLAKITSLMSQEAVVSH